MGVTGNGKSQLTLRDWLYIATALIAILGFIYKWGTGPITMEISALKAQMNTIHDDHKKYCEKHEEYCEKLEAEIDGKIDRTVLNNQVAPIKESIQTIEKDLKTITTNLSTLVGYLKAKEGGGVQ